MDPRRKASSATGIRSCSMVAAKRRYPVPEHPEDQSRLHGEKQYPPLTGGGPGDGLTHTHCNGTGKAIPTGDDVPDEDTPTHRHMDSGDGPAAWPDAIPS